MNIEKVKNYNQVALAVLVSAGVLMAVVGLISLIVVMISEVFGNFRSNSNYADQGTYASENVVNEDNAGIYDKYITCNFPELIDTTNQIYLIPVTQATQQELVSNFSRKFSYSTNQKVNSSDNVSGYDYYEKTFVNMIVYDAKNGTREILFKKNLVIGQYGNEVFKDDVLVLMEIALSDTDKDGVLSIADQTSLFIYSTRSKQLRELKYNNKSVLHFRNIPNTKDYLVKFGVDVSKRTENKTDTDLSVVCKYVYDQDKLVVVYDEKVQKELNAITNKK